MTLTPGTYKARPVSAQFGVVERTNNEYIRIGFAIDFEDGSSHSISADLFFTQEKNTARSIESLRYCGWVGTDLAALEMGVEGMGSATVELAVISEPYTNPETNETKGTLKVQWINRPGGVPVAKPMSSEQRRAFAAKMRGPLLAEAQRAGARPAAAAAPPQRAAARPQANGTREQWDGQGPDPEEIPF